jgi:hypothetical protein
MFKGSFQNFAYNSYSELMTGKVMNYHLITSFLVNSNSLHTA